MPRTPLFPGRDRPAGELTAAADREGPANRGDRRQDAQPAPPGAGCCGTRHRYTSGAGTYPGSRRAGRTPLPAHPWPRTARWAGHMGKAAAGMPRTAGPCPGDNPRYGEERCHPMGKNP